MSVFVEQVTKLLDENPNDFYATDKNTINSNIHKIKISNLGNVGLGLYFTSIVNLHVNEVKTKLQGRDSKKLEKAAIKWFKQASMSNFKKAA